MSRRLKVAAAQLGPINRADSRASVVKRLVEMLKEADSRGSKFVVFPELALTTFFPRWWMEDQAEIDKYFEAQMPSPETAPLFELARSKGIGFYLGYAELTEEEGRTRRFNTSILVGPDGRLVGIRRHGLGVRQGGKQPLATGGEEMVGVAGFEPTTLCPPDKCATRLRYTPTEAHP